MSKRGHRATHRAAHRQTSMAASNTDPKKPDSAPGTDAATQGAALALMLREPQEEEMTRRYRDRLREPGRPRDVGTKDRRP
jgi:hypothetical protein